jgi:hypothetical protein
LVGVSEGLLFFTNKAFTTIFEIGTCPEKLVLERGNFSSGLLSWRKGGWCGFGVG